MAADERGDRGRRRRRSAAATAAAMRATAAQLSGQRGSSGARASSGTEPGNLLGEEETTRSRRCHTRNPPSLLLLYSPAHYNRAHFFSPPRFDNKSPALPDQPGPSAAAAVAVTNSSYTPHPTSNAGSSPAPSTRLTSSPSGTTTILTAFHPPPAPPAVPPIPLATSTVHSCGRLALRLRQRVHARPSAVCDSSAARSAASSRRASGETSIEFERVGNGSEERNRRPVQVNRGREAAAVPAGD